MARVARRLSFTGIYHVIFRGVNRYAIFEEYKDYEKLLQIIADLKEDIEFDIYAYCLMNNHVHLLIRELELGQISLIMKRMLIRYAGWFNKKYDRSGILISNRFKSEPVEDEQYLLTAIRYIHQNPVNAGITTIDDYKWSSFREYLEQDSLIKTDFVFSIIDKDSFIKYHYENNEEYIDFDEIENNNCIESIRKIIKEMGLDPDKIGCLPKKERNIIIIDLRKNFSIRQIERATGISRGVISRC
ncbi:MAG: transposase [Sedimentibacter sp.]